MAVNDRLNFTEEELKMIEEERERARTGRTISQAEREAQELERKLK